MSYRLFAAIRPPDEIRARLLATMSGVNGAHWQTDEQLHLTLAFFGVLDGVQAEALAEALYAVEQEAFPLSLGLFGSFDGPRKGRTATLWLGVEPSEPLARLAAKVRTIARRQGIALRHQRFLPHMTLARFRGASSEDLAPYLHKVAPPGGTWQVSRFHLMESFLRPKGALYLPRVSYRLKENSAGRYPPQDG